LGGAALNANNDDLAIQATPECGGCNRDEPYKQKLLR
jgi:hypothetical protein